MCSIESGCGHFSKRGLVDYLKIGEMFCPPNGTYTYNRDVPSNENHETGEDAFSRAFRRLSGLPEIVLIKARTLPHPSTYDELMESAKRIRRN